MTNLFHNKSMPFYQFGETMELKPIPWEDWIPFIIGRFESNGQEISPEIAVEICEFVECQSSYVQQLAWNVMVESGAVVDKKGFDAGCEAIMAQSESYFVEQTKGLTSYQMNFLRLLCLGINRDFGSRDVQKQYSLGSPSNIQRVKQALADREIVEQAPDGTCRFMDPLLRRWFSRRHL